MATFEEGDVTGTDVAVRTGFDLTRAPDEQWNDAMVEMVTRTLFRGTEITKNALYYCLSVAEGLGLNPMIQEIYFIPAKSRDGKGPTLQPYIGRNGLVKKARERACYFESDTVHENDRFRYTRRKDGSVELTHSYGAMDRGPIVGAYAFLHDDDGRRKPAFFYAEWDQYVPTFDQEWKFKASPWGNQASAMIEKCAMIGAGRKRLDLGNVLIDGEIARYEQQGAVGPGGEPNEEAESFDFSGLPGDEGLRERLQNAVTWANDVAPLSWPAAKLEMVTAGMDADQLLALAGQIEQEAERAASRAPQGAQGRSEPGAGDSSGDSEPPGEAITDAQVIDEEHVAGLRKRKASLEAQLREPGLSDQDQDEIGSELDGVERELAAAEDPGQGSLL